MLARRIDKFRWQELPRLLYGDQGARVPEASWLRGVEVSLVLKDVAPDGAEDAVCADDAVKCLRGAVLEVDVDLLPGGDETL